MRIIPEKSVHKALHRSPFMVVAFESATGPRCAGVVPEFDGQVIWLGSVGHDFKVRCMRKHHEVSVTATVPTRVPILASFIPPSTVTFKGRAEVLPIDAPGVPTALRKGIKVPADTELAAVRIEPIGDFISYGLDLPVWKLTDTDLARGRTEFKAATAMG
ncbi:MAG: hypothetical protein ACK5O2_08925 [Microthrixaceae bacterium]